jgi:hypothetical protein
MPQYLTIFPQIKESQQIAHCYGNVIESEVMFRISNYVPAGIVTENDYSTICDPYCPVALSLCIMRV